MKSKSNNQVQKEIKTVFKKYGVTEYRVDFVPSDKLTVKNFFHGAPPFFMQIALTGLARALNLSMGELSRKEEP
jgi:hypothetical protein